MAKSSESFFDKVWKLFTSLRLTIFLLISLAVVSIFGTVIEQNKSLEEYRQVFSEPTIKFLSAIGMFDMYHSIWFLMLLVVFSLNLTFCTLDRLPNVFKIIKNPRLQLDEKREKSLSLAHRWKKKADVRELADKYAQALQVHFAKPVETTNSDTVHLYAEKGPLSRFGVYITHLSVIIIFLGAMIGNIFGFKGYVNIVEGRSVTSVQTRGSKGQVDLGFSVKNNKFWIEYYANGAPKEYFSDLSVIDQGKEVKKERIEVNSPLQYKGIWFYQSSYGPAGAANITVDVKNPDGSIKKTLTLLPNQSVTVEGLGTVSAVDYSENFQGFGPALLVSLNEEGEAEKRFWIFKNFPDFDKRRGGSNYLSFSGIDTIFYTGLQVARDPGVNIVWVGCTIMVIGILVAFFGSHRRLWLKIVPVKDGRAEMVLAGAANKNRLAFEKTFGRIKDEIAQL
jgi:cytochrome c biogenesis protein